MLNGCVNCFLSSRAIYFVGNCILASLQGKPTSLCPCYENCCWDCISSCLFTGTFYAIFHSWGKIIYEAQTTPGLGVLLCPMWVVANTRMTHVKKVTVVQKNAFFLCRYSLNRCLTSIWHWYDTCQTIQISVPKKLLFSFLDTPYTFFRQISITSKS